MSRTSLKNRRSTMLIEVIEISIGSVVMPVKGGDIAPMFAAHPLILKSSSLGSMRRRGSSLEKFISQEASVNLRSCA